MSRQFGQGRSTSCPASPRRRGTSATRCTSLTAQSNVWWQPLKNIHRESSNTNFLLKRMSCIFTEENPTLADKCFMSISSKMCPAQQHGHTQTEITALHLTLTSKGALLQSLLCMEYKSSTMLALPPNKQEPQPPHKSLLFPMGAPLKPEELDSDLKADPCSFRFHSNPKLGCNTVSALGSNPASCQLLNEEISGEQDSPCPQHSSASLDRISMRDLSEGSTEKICWEYTDTAAVQQDKLHYCSQGARGVHME